MSDLSELFATDPLHLSDQDTGRIVERMRLSHAQFELGVKSPVAERRAKTGPGKAGAELLKDLGFE